MDNNNNNKPNRLQYNNGSNVLPEGAFRISPSQLNMFFAKPHEWYNTQVLGNAGFTGNTSSVLGTCMHFIAEMYGTKGTVTDEDLQEIEDYIDQEAKGERNDSGELIVDPDIIRTHYKVMGMALVNGYLKPNMPTACEDFLAIGHNGIYFPSGSCDCRVGDTVVDYKSTGLLTAPDKISYAYKLQLLCYAWLYTKQGIPINRIRIVYVTRNNVGRVSEKTGKPMKDYPSVATEITETITKDDLDFIESLLELVVDTMKAHEKYPELANVIWKDQRLKQIKEDYKWQE